MSADRVDEIVAKARGMAEDMSLRGVRDWKALHPGSLAIGYMPIYAPRPLFEAIGCLPVAVFGGGDAIDVVRGDAFYQSYICHIPRSTLELAVSGKLDCIDGMVFPSICDVIRNLGGMWKMLFPDRWTGYLDLPQSFDPRTGGRFYTSELRRMARELEARGAARLDPERLLAAIAAENDRRGAIVELDAIRKAEPWRVRASEAYAVVRAGAAMPALEHAAFIREMVEAARSRPVRAYDNVRVVLRGAFCEQPPLALIRALESAGSDIVSDDLQLGLRMIRGAIEVAPGEDPLASLSRAYIERGAATASRYAGGEAVKGAELVEEVRACGADGVIFAAASFCDPALLDQPMLEAALDSAGIPHTSFKFSENTGQFGVIREQAGAFSDAVKLWGTAT